MFVGIRFLISALFAVAALAGSPKLRGGDNGPRRADLMLPASFSADVSLVVPMLMATPATLVYRSVEGGSEFSLQVSVRGVYDAIQAMMDADEKVPFEQWVQESFREGWTTYTLGASGGAPFEQLQLEDGRLLQSIEEIAEEYERNQKQAEVLGFVRMSVLQWAPDRMRHMVEFTRRVEAGHPATKEEGEEHALPRDQETKKGGSFFVAAAPKVQEEDGEVKQLKLVYEDGGLKQGALRAFVLKRDDQMGMLSEMGLVFNQQPKALDHLKAEAAPLLVA